MIFLFRKQSKKPFHCRFKEDVLDLFKLDDDPEENPQVKDPIREKLTQQLLIYKSVKNDEALLLEIEFQTLTEYMAMLETYSKILKSFHKKALIYLSAAVSDFYIPESMLPRHKISKAGEGLTITLSPVRKVVHLIKEQWAPEAFLVTFKLETDENVLYEKAKKSLLTNGQDLVIANLLNTRHHTVQIMQLSKTGPSKNIDTSTISLNPHQITNKFPIEELIVKEVVLHHSDYIKQP